MSEVEYHVEYSTAQPGHLHLVGIMTELEGEDLEVFSIFEEQSVNALNFGKIFFGSGGRLAIRMKRKAL
jgi:hypothetical protein